MRHLIVNGCSFTDGNFDMPRGSYTWANVVRDYYKQSDLLFTTIARKGKPNENIVSETLAYLKNINSSDDVILVIQLTAIDRIIVNGKRSPTIGSILKSLNWMQWGMSKNEKVDSWWENYFMNEYSEEKHIESFVDNILLLQTELKSYSNVKYKIFCGWDILTQDTGESDMWSLTERYNNKNDKLVSELYTNVNEKFTKIDLEKFWFFENESIHYGGLSQWVQYNVPVEHWYRDVNSNPIDFHPSDYAHREFANKVIIPIIEDIK